MIYNNFKNFKKGAERMKNLEQRWENLTLADDFLFGKIMRDPKLCAEMLRRIFPDLDIGEIKSIETQKTLKHALHIRGVRFDILTTAARNIFDIEAQNRKLKDWYKRPRAYQIVIGYNALNKKSLKNPALMKTCQTLTLFLSVLLIYSVRAGIFIVSEIFALKIRK